MNEVYRIRFIRSPKSSYQLTKNKTLSIVIELCDEFNLSIKGICIQYQAGFVSQDNFTLKNGKSDLECDYKYYSSQDTICNLHLSIPNTIGKYHLFVAANQPNNLNSRIHILPIISDTIDIVCNDDIHDFVSSQLNCFRIFKSSQQDILIKESYGEFIGSWVYDASIVMMRYLETSSYLKDHCISIALELGSGTGLLSIYLSCVISQVYVSDLHSQMKLIQENVENNHRKNNCNIIELDWKTSSIPSVIHGIVFDLIVACDVFYDNDLTKHLMKLLCHLSTKHILIAQKLRNYLNTTCLEMSILNPSIFDIISSYNFEATCLWKEANVIIWEIKPFNCI